MLVLGQGRLAGSYRLEGRLAQSRGRGPAWSHKDGADGEHKRHARDRGHSLGQGTGGTGGPEVTARVPAERMPPLRGAGGRIRSESTDKERGQAGDRDFWVICLGPLGIQ